ncbi:SCP-like protein [Oesophagostomum dentatum]|uniref:SCP-like protein n=1 Tax=Oesophagostomum dentatum TaxID=61180 RepID=A0A0B1T2Y5_OESDE|nr:SCP-like protein [Oesophagostomum dentatum]
MTDALRTKFLDAHNYRRELLATGQVAKRNGNYLPKAANMQRMRYNCALEVQVGEFLKTCPKAGSAESARIGTGENFLRISQDGIADYTKAVEKAVTSWWKVIRTTEGIGMAVTFRAHHVGAPISSFTQMAWATSRKLGCAVAKCTGDYIAVCRYQPRGNYVEQVVYAKGTPCSACPSGAWCTNGALCALP